MTTRIIFLAMGLTALWGCGRTGGGYTPEPPPKVEAVTVPNAPDPSMFPLKTDNQWTYSVEMSQVFNDKPLMMEPTQVTFKVVRVVDTPEGQKGEIRILDAGGNETDRQLWLVSPKGIFQVALGMDQIPFKPIQPVIVFPVKEDLAFSWQGTGLDITNNRSTIKADSIIRKPQKVDTEAGSFSAIPVETVWQFGPNYHSSGTTTAWLKPALGIVRFHQETVEQKADNRKGKNGAMITVRTITKLKLKSYSLK